MIDALLALGANIGDPLRQLRRAVDRLQEVLEIEAVSDVFITEPVGIREQPDFYNLVLAGRTERTVYDVHRSAMAIEDELGRRRTVLNAPRVIDIDLLTYGELVLSSPTLVLPHPRLELRTFVLAPLAEIVPEWRHPLTLSTAAEALGQLTEPSKVTRWGALGD